MSYNRLPPELKQNVASMLDPRSRYSLSQTSRDNRNAVDHTREEADRRSHLAIMRHTIYNTPNDIDTYVIAHYLRTPETVSALILTQKTDVDQLHMLLGIFNAYHVEGVRIPFWLLDWIYEDGLMFPGSLIADAANDIFDPQTTQVIFDTRALQWMNTNNMLSGADPTHLLLTQRHNPSSIEYLLRKIGLTSMSRFR